MARSPKLAELSTVSEFSHWLAETIQEKAAKENAGFIEISVSVHEAGAFPAKSNVSVTSHTASFHLTVAGGESDGN